MNTTTKALLCAAFTGAVSWLSDFLLDPHADLGHAGHVALTGAIIGVAGYLKQSPIQQMPKPQEPPKSVE